MTRLVLGINSAHADSSAALVSEHGTLAAIAEERINRKKHCAGFPRLAIEEVLRLAGADVRDITDVAVARDPMANIAQKAAFVAMHPRTNAKRAISRIGVHRAVRSEATSLADQLGVSANSVRAQFHRVEHHVAHVASAFFWSPWETATGISVDGAGDFATSLIASCRGNDIRIERKSYWPHSLGVFYTAVCQFVGFDRFGEEYKLMGLSAYGVNRYAREMKKLVQYVPGKGVRLDLKYFTHHRGGEGLEAISNEDEVSIPRLWSERMSELFGPPRKRTEPLTDRDRDVAASLQFRFEDVYSALIEDAVRITGDRRVVMAGGSVLNSVGNGKVITERTIDAGYYHPAASDDGTAMGAALQVMHGVHGVPRTGHVPHAYWGSDWNDTEIEKALRATDLPYKKLDRESLLDTASGALSQGRIVGWFQGREEWGPRALGNRSILCHPGWPNMKAILNGRIKNREPFRPFAPAVRREKLSECFQGDHEVPFMIIVYKVRPEWRERLSAVTHEDGTGRVQSVSAETNQMFYDLIGAFERKTGIPVLLNTSFNENEPIVHTPKQAVDCFARTRMDALGIGSFWLEKPAP